MGKINLLGQRFGRFVVLAEAPKRPQSRSAYWHCRCDCGTERVVEGKSLRNGSSKSCGCYMKDAMTKRFTTHGHSRHPETSYTYRKWVNAKTRCLRENSPRWHDYGGRGIKICDRWRDSFAHFLEDMGFCPPGYSLERLDNDGDYEPGNCVWATLREQAQNKRNTIHLEYRGKHYPSLKALSKKLGITYHVILYRYKRRGKLTLEEVISRIQNPKPYKEGSASSSLQSKSSKTAD